MTRNRQALLLAAAYAVLLLAWTFADPAGGVPDEGTHLYKAVAAGRLDLRGEKVLGKFSAADQQRYNVQAVRAFNVPSLLVSGNFGCNKFNPPQPMTCFRVTDLSSAPRRVETQLGGYPPFLYIVPGIFTRLGHGPRSAVLLGRLPNAGLAALLLGLAAFALRRRDDGGVSLAGLLLAATPMVLFLGASLNVSGLEAAAGIAFGAVLLAASRSAQDLRRCAFPAAIAGSVLALSRPLGPVWVLLGLALYTAFAGRRARSDIGAARAALTPALAILGAALAGALGWDAFSRGANRLPLDRLPDAIGSVWDQLPRLLTEAVGTFGWIDAHMDDHVYQAWYLMVVVLVALALWLGTWSQRLALVMLAGLGLVIAVSLQGLLLGPTGDLLQARYLMALWLMLPLAAAEAVARRAQPGGLLTRLTFPVVAVVCAVIQLIGFYTSGRRQSVGSTGARLFFLHPAWSPPAGWLPWVLLAVVGGALMLSSAWARERGQTRSTPA